jgi:hypothetical protein
MGLIMLPESEVWLARRDARRAKEAQAREHHHANSNGLSSSSSSLSSSYQSLDGHSNNGHSNGKSNGEDEYTKNREAGDDNGDGPPAIDIDELNNKKNKNKSLIAIDNERQSLISAYTSSSDSSSSEETNEPQNCCVRRMIFLPKPIRNSYAPPLHIHHHSF